MGRIFGTTLEATKIVFMPTQIDIGPLAKEHGVTLSDLTNFESETINRERVDFTFALGGAACHVAVVVEGGGNSFWDIIEGSDVVLGPHWGIPDFCVAIAEQLLSD